MKPTYRIKDWDKHFENHESRKVKRSYWVAVPNRHDGKSYRRIAVHPEGVQVFAAWILILEAASKMPERGVLADEDGPLDAEDLSAMTGFPAPIFDSAFNLLTQERFGWLSTGEVRAKRRKSPATSRNLPESPGIPGNAAVELQGTELQGTEGNGTKDTAGEPPFSGSDFLAALAAYDRTAKQRRVRESPEQRQALFKKLAAWGEAKATTALVDTVANAWRGVFEPKEGNNNGTNKSRFESSSERNARNLQENVEYIRGLSGGSGAADR